MRDNGNNGRNRLAAAAVRFQPDSRLVDLVREGHDVAFEEIVRRYRSPLVGFAAVIVPRDHAEDVVQEALAKAHRALLGGAAGINLRPWLYTIVRNRSLNALRDDPVHDHLDENFDGVPQPPDVAARREELSALIAGLKGLPGPQRDALVGRELEGRSHEEIAGSLGTTPGAVRGLIYRARTTLRDGIGLLIPLPLVRAVLGSGPTGPDAAGGAAAAGLAAGGGGVALKAGATLGIAVIAVGSGIAIQHRGGGKPESAPTLADRGAARSHASRGGSSSTAGGSRFRGSSGVRGDHGSSSGPGPGGPDDRGSSGPSHGGNSGPGSGSSGGGSASSGPGGGGSSGSGGGGGSGSTSATSGDDGGSGGGGGDGGGSGTSGSGSDDGGSGTSGSGDGTSGGGGTSGSGDSGTSGSGDGSGSSVSSDDLTTTTTTITTDGDGGGEGPG